MPNSNYFFTDKERHFLHSKGFVKIDGSGDFWKYQDATKFDHVAQIGQIYELVICIYLEKGRKVFKATSYKTMDEIDAHRCHKSTHKSVASEGLEAFFQRIITQTSAECADEI